MHEFYDSDEDSDWSQYNGTASSSTEYGCEVEESDVGSNVSMEISDVADPSVLLAKDGTRWKEVYNPPDPVTICPRIVDHTAQCNSRCDDIKTASGKLRLILS